MKYRNLLLMLMFLTGSAQVFSMTEAETEKLIEKYQKSHPSEFPKIEEPKSSSYNAEKRRAELHASRKLEALRKLIAQYEANGDHAMAQALKEKEELYYNRFKATRDSRVMPH